jgi:hypothetical protein
MVSDPVLFFHRPEGRGHCVIVDRKAHCANLVLLGDDDFLSQAANRFIVARSQHGARHVDRALVVRNHHRDEVAVDITGRGHMHRRHHALHGFIVLREESTRFRGKARCRSGFYAFVMMCVLRRRRRHCRSHHGDRENCTRSSCHLHCRVRSAQIAMER